MSIKNELWYKVENLVAQKLGLKRIAFSGGQWPLKEDAEDIDIICQVKATEKKQITIKGIDLKDLYKRSLIQHKVPLFVFYIGGIEYDKGKVWVAMPLEDFEDLGIKELIKQIIY